MHKQEHPCELPFPPRSFDLITAVCVYHHVRVDARRALTSEMRPDESLTHAEQEGFQPQYLPISWFGKFDGRNSSAGGRGTAGSVQARSA
jgi:hypothetical protein